MDDLEFFKSHGVGLINASPLALGLLTNNVDPPDWHIAPLLVKKYVKKAAKLCKDRGADLGKCKKLHLTTLNLHKQRLLLLIELRTVLYDKCEDHLSLFVITFARK